MKDFCKVAWLSILFVPKVRFNYIFWRSKLTIFEEKSLMLPRVICKGTGNLKVNVVARTAKRLSRGAEE